MKKQKIILSWDIYVITNEELAFGRSNVDITRAALEGGAKIIQLRDKHSSSRKFYEDALQIRKLTRATNTTFIVNDRLDIALAADADGLHVGQNDLPASIARKYLGKSKILGISAINFEQSIEAAKQGADYLGVGPIFEARKTKPDADPPIGLDNLKVISDALDIPIVAIGGINIKNARDIIDAGANSVAVISAIVSTPNISNSTYEFIQAIKNE